MWSFYKLCLVTESNYTFAVHLHNDKPTLSPITLPLDQKKMILDHIGTRSEDRITTVYQVDPGFYKKILSRNRSLSNSSRIFDNPGEVPFTWEMQPGRPREAPNIETVPPIRLPPAVHGLNMPKPRFHHSGPMAYISKYIKKLKMIKNMQLGLPPAVPSSGMPKPKIPHKKVKVTFLKSLEKAKKAKNLRIGKKTNSSYLHKKSKAKPVETNGYASGTDESDGSCIIDGNHFTPSPTTSVASGSSRSSSSSSFNHAKKLPKKLRFWSLHKELRKWRTTK
ncbi:unnamed protein product [Dovyalis caffra]|uniref:Uncharacterized protein n=1 Tax=Dovyalis caffra TaxID=77055 RepID=A0AAV1RMF3_9ROSI|nr:unnamed protein product [Dovyalis caffra]